MSLDLNALLSLVGTLGAVALGAGLNARSAARAEAKGERESLGAQFTSMVLAVTQLRAAVEEDRILWSNWKEHWRATGLAAMTGAGVAAFARGSDKRQFAAIAGGAAWFLTQERTQQKAAASRITPNIAAVGQAAAPLLLHPSSAVQETTERLMAAAYSYHETRNVAGFDDAVAAFGTAVRAEMELPRRRRPFRRRQTQTDPAQ
ncbi:hypothetical protein ACH4KC_15490 [Streptomyces griseoaurantiacus]|uniref:hypothetical protein n=1 Tax=Streptomyces TaxID=1883 RepID=UPI00210C443A|nr:hypothetical protein [Streptomyces coelicoflavus]MCQ4202609.1 hypothetical protein [Streptomyces coelicoflavus]